MNKITFGIHPVSELLATSPQTIERLHLAQEATSQGPLFELLRAARKKKVPVRLAPKAELNRLCPEKNHQGAVALHPMREYADFHSVLAQLHEKGKQPFFLLPASIQDTANLGAIIRSSLAFGVDAVLLEKKFTAPLNSSVAKASAGALEKVPVCRPVNLQGVLLKLAQQGFTIIGADHQAQKRLDQISCTGPVVLIMGGEHRSIPPYLKKCCTECARVDQSAAVHSLNVSVATGIFLHALTTLRKSI